MTVNNSEEISSDILNDVTSSGDWKEVRNHHNQLGLEEYMFNFMTITVSVDGPAPYGAGTFADTTTKKFGVRTYRR